MPRKRFGPKRDEEAGDWNKLNNDKFYCLQFASSVIWVIKSRRIRWVGHVSCKKDRTGAYKVLTGKSKRRSLRGRCSNRWEANIEMDLRDMWECVNWISLAQDREKWQAVMSMAMNL